MGELFSAILFYFIILPISWIPLSFLYGFSNFLFVIFYYIFPYRKKIVLQNLRNSFPEKSEKELKQITKKFYLHFCDLLVETIKLFSASQQAIESRVKLVNPELLEKYYS